MAPYEADAQMAYLALNALVDVVITEDSDLLTYGCPRVGPGRGRADGAGRGGGAEAGPVSGQRKARERRQFNSPWLEGPAEAPAQRPTTWLPCPPRPAHRAQVFFKMDKSGEGEEIELRNLPHVRELSFMGFTHDMFQEVGGRRRRQATAAAAVWPVAAETHFHFTSASSHRLGLLRPG